jgi:hypothetical protein
MNSRQEFAADSHNDLSHSQSLTESRLQPSTVRSALDFFLEDYFRYANDVCLGCAKFALM